MRFMRLKILALIVLAAVFVSCSPVKVRMFPGADRFPPTSPQSVDLLRREPPRPHIAFAEIVYKPSPRVSRHEVEWILRERAARIGADALIIEVDNIFLESVWISPVRRIRQYPRFERVIVGIAIRYR
jgi:hypothetical protein